MLHQTCVIYQAFPLSLELSNKQFYLALKSVQKEGYARGQLTKRTVKVQGTTYMRTMVSARGMMRWHYQLEEVTKVLEEKNQPRGLWKELSPHGWANVDEENVRQNGHVVKINASRHISKHEKVETGRYCPSCLSL